MKKILLITSLLGLTQINAQLYTPNGTISGSTSNSSTGNIGIGVSSPTRKLSVAGDIYAGGPASLSFQDDATYTINQGNVPTLTASSIVVPRYGLIAPNASGSAELWITGGAGIRMFTGDQFPKFNILPNGNVGIGINTPIEKLDVNGNARINNRNFGYTFLGLGQQANDQIIADNTADKLYGGGYFFRVHNESVTNNYIDAIIIAENGNIGIGVNPPQNKLDVAGKSSFSDNMKVNAKIEAREIKVTQSPTADFVFEEDYALPTMEEVEKHIKEKKHLPEIASAKEMEKEGVNVGEFQIKLLQKIEELTLYSIEQNKLNKLQSEELKAQSEKLKQLEFENQQIKSLLERVEKLENNTK